MYVHTYSWRHGMMELPTRAMVYMVEIFLLGSS
jgi:hypothetical protein